MKIHHIIKIFRQEFQRSIYLKKVLYSYLLISCMIFILFSIMLFFMTNKNYSSALENLQDQTIVQAHSVNQTILKDLVGCCYNLLENASMTEILYGDRYNTSIALEAAQLNDNLRKTSSLIVSSYFINFRTGTVIDQNGRSAIANHTDQQIFDMLESMTPSVNPLFCYPRHISYIINQRTTPDYPVLTMVFYRNKSGALVLNLDYEAYRQMLSLDESNYVEITLINSTGNVICSSDSSLFGMDYSENELYQKIQHASGRRGSFLYAFNGRRYSVKYIKNEGLGITYICGLNKLLIYPENSMLSSLLGYTVIYLLLGFLLSLFLSWVIYKPLRQLKSYIASHSAASSLSAESAGPVNDFNYLSNAYQEVLDINTRLQNASSAWQREQNNKILKYLLTDPQGVYNMYAAELESLNACYHEKNYLILLCGIDPSSLQTEMETEANLLKYVIQNVTGELLSSAFLTQHIEMASPYVIFLLNFSAPEPETLRELLRQAQAFILKHYHITFSVGIGDTVQDLTELSLSYQSSFEAFSQRFLTGNGSIHAADLLRLTPVHDQQYPFAVSDALIATIKSLAPASVPERVHSFIAAVESYNIEQILCFILQLSSSLQKLEATSYIETVGNWDYRTLEQSTLADIEARLVDRCLFDITQLASIRDASSEKKELIGQILSLVEENIYNPGLSVVFLADKVHLSVNYLRNIFKENTGDSLSGYITRRKLALICDLLQNSDMPLSDISDKLGFSTKNYFFTFFKKHTGMTPSDYRKKQKES